MPYKNPEDGRAYHHANRDVLVAKMRERRAANLDEYQARERQYYRENAEARRVAGRAWYWANRERSLESQRAWRESNRERVAELNRANQKRGTREFLKRNVVARQSSTHHGLPWTITEDLVAIRKDISNTTKAFMLSRTIAAVKNRLQYLRRQAVTA